MFTPQVPDTAFHPNFRALRETYTEFDRQVVNEWADGFVDRDNKFVIEFQTTFNSCFWELYLFACLKEVGLAVDFRVSSPDFLISEPCSPFCIEGTTANSADGEPKEWESKAADFAKVQREPIVNMATIRLANAITSKFTHFQKVYALLGHVAGRPFVLAIAPFEQPWFFVQNDQAMRRVLYAYDRPLLHFIEGSSRALVVGHEHMHEIKKPSGATVPLGYFLNPKMADISAVIFSNTATFGKIHALSRDPNPHVYFETLRFNAHGDKPTHTLTQKADYVEPLLDGLHVFHNPFAKFSIDADLFRRPGVTQHTWVAGAPWPPFTTTHGALIQRSVITVRPKPSS